MKKYFCGPAMLLLVLLLFTGCGKKETVQQSVDTAMGTIIRQTIYLSDAVAGVEERMELSVTDEVLQLIDKQEKEQLSWRISGSQIAQVNAGAGTGEYTAISEELAERLGRCLAISEESGGAFDITIGKVSRLWDLDAWSAETDTSAFTIPQEAALQEALQTTGWQRLTLSCHEGSFSVKLPEGMQLDLGAVGKGAALDDIRAYLQTQPQVKGAVISVGGSILTFGSKPDGTAWNVGIVDPLDTSRNIGVLTLSGEWYVSTSGDYERYVEKDGVRYHHILNPADGYPADGGLASVTILGEKGNHTGLDTDAFSTACFVLGETKARKLLENHDLEALFVDQEGNVTMTDGMQQFFHLSDEGK